jgi:hypothetical protein
MRTERGEKHKWGSVLRESNQPPDDAKGVI